MDLEQKIAQCCGTCVNFKKNTTYKDWGGQNSGTCFHSSEEGRRTDKLATCEGWIIRDGKRSATLKKIKQHLCNHLFDIFVTRKNFNTATGALRKGSISIRIRCLKCRMPTIDGFTYINVNSYTGDLAKTLNLTKLHQSFPFHLLKPIKDNFDFKFKLLKLIVEGVFLYDITAEDLFDNEELTKRDYNWYQFDEFTDEELIKLRLPTKEAIKNKSKRTDGLLGEMPF